MARSTMRARAAGQDRVVRSQARRPIESILISIVYFVFSVIIVLLALRFMLLLLGANAAAPFVQIIYALSAPFMAPFYAVFGRTQIDGSIFEWSALLAIAIYALIAWGIASLIAALTPRYAASRVETVEEVHEDEMADHAGDPYADRPVYNDPYNRRGTPAH